jgi:putative membrane protein
MVTGHHCAPQRRGLVATWLVSAANGVAAWNQGTPGGRLWRTVGAVDTEPGGAAQAIEAVGDGQMPWHDHGMGGVGWGLMVIGGVVFWGLVIAGLVVLVRYLRRGDQNRSQSPTAEQVLGERFARGDIDEEEYRRRLQVLRGGRP